MGICGKSCGTLTCYRKTEGLGAAGSVLNGRLLAHLRLPPASYFRSRQVNGNPGSLWCPSATAIGTDLYIPFGKCTFGGPRVDFDPRHATMTYQINRHRRDNVKITVEALIKADLSAVWQAWNNPDDIKQWNAASDDWHTTRSTVDLREGGRLSSRMEAKDGGAGFDFEATYTRIVPHELIAFRMEDGRDVSVVFTKAADGVLVKETFEAETENDPEIQHQGWQAILDNFARHVEAKRTG